MKRWMTLLPILGVMALAGWAYGEKDKEQEKDGAKHKTEVKVSLDQCPEAVQKTLKKASEGGTIEEIEKVTKKDVVVYEADVVIGETTYEVKVAADGKLISKKVDDEDDDNGGAKEDDDDGDHGGADNDDDEDGDHGGGDDDDDGEEDDD